MRVKPEGLAARTVRIGDPKPDIVRQFFGRSHKKEVLHSQKRLYHLRSIESLPALLPKAGVSLGEGLATGGRYSVWDGLINWPRRFWDTCT